MPELHSVTASHLARYPGVALKNPSAHSVQTRSDVSVGASLSSVPGAQSESGVHPPRSEVAVGATAANSFQVQVVSAWQTVSEVGVDATAANSSPSHCRACRHEPVPADGANVPSTQGAHCRSEVKVGSTTVPWPAGHSGWGRRHCLSLVVVGATATFVPDKQLVHGTHSRALVRTL